jgi:thioredoxin-like negative regulator of GroEL
MISWIATRLFYAIVFFLLGAWLVSESPQFRAWMHRASHVGSQSFDKMREWTSATLIKTPDVTNTGSSRSAAESAAPPPSGERGQAQTAAAPQASAANAPAAKSPAAAEAPAAAPPQASAPPAPEANSSADLLARARQAYARKDTDAAIDAYRAYIAQNPEAIGARGELGDVYFAAGRKQDAAQMYFECATKNLDAGNIAGAKALIGAVRQGDPSLAGDLEHRVAAASNKKN